jgi:hypothetical protein
MCLLMRSHAREIYLKRLLETFEAGPGPVIDINALSAAGISYSDPQFIFHMEIFQDEGLVERVDHERGFGLVRGIDGFESWSVVPLRLTADGHKLLETLRDQRIWATIKRQFKTAGIATLVTVSKTLLESNTKASLGSS